MKKAGFSLFRHKLDGMLKQTKIDFYNKSAITVRSINIQSN